MKTYIHNHMNEIVEKMCDLININTVYDTPCDNMPFGKGIEDGLNFLGELATSFGFLVKTFDGYALEITAGTGENIIGVLCHVDVVPAGEGWETDPFKAEIIDGKIFGRGSFSNKGSMISCLYAMKYLFDNELIPLNSKIRMIVGTDQQSLWRGISYYKTKVHNFPTVGFTPAGEFPVIYAEKGLLDFDISYPVSKEKFECNLVNIYGGQSRNSVPSSVICEIKAKDANKIVDLLKTKLDDVSYEIELNENIVLKIKGKSAHGMSPEKGVNAFGIMMETLLVLGKSINCYDFIEVYDKYLKNDFNGEKLDIFMQDDESGKLTFNDGIISFKNNIIKLGCNLRYPVSIAYFTFKEKLVENFENLGFIYSFYDHLEPVYVKRNSNLVKTLVSAYQEEVLDFSKPSTTSNASYARAMENIVCFGPMYKDQEDLAHEANEFLHINQLEKITVIYAKALLGLLY